VNANNSGGKESIIREWPPTAKSGIEDLSYWRLTLIVVPILGSYVAGDNERVTRRSWAHEQLMIINAATEKAMKGKYVFIRDDGNLSIYDNNDEQSLRLEGKTCSDFDNILAKCFYFTNRSEIKLY